MPDPYNLRRFLDAQAPIWDEVLAELGAGRKRTHWMWFVFPQVAGLGFSATAQFFAIASRAEAAAYLSHPVLSPRLVECCRLLARVEGRSAREIMGSPDDLKLRSSLTLFLAVDPANPALRAVLDGYFGGRGDERTIELLG